jgi:signal transduction histidine kinase
MVCAAAAADDFQTHPRSEPTPAGRLEIPIAKAGATAKQSGHKYGAHRERQHLHPGNHATDKSFRAGARRQRWEGVRVNSRGKAFLWAMLPLLLLAGPYFWQGKNLEHQLANEARTRTKHTLELHAAAVQRSLDRLGGKLDTLESFVLPQRGPTNHISLDKFGTLGAGLHASAEWIRAFQIVTDGIITHTYPLKSNEAALGYNLLLDERPVIGGDVIRALETGRVTITGPLALVQGGMGIILRKPIPRQNDEPARLVAIVFNIEPLLAASGIHSPRTDEVELALRRDTGEVFFGAAEVFAKSPVMQRLQLPDGAWDIAALPRAAATESRRNPAAGFYLAGGIIIFLICLLVFLLARRQADLTETVAEQTRELQTELAERKQAETRVRHLNRVYAVLSDINQSIVREKDSQAVLAAACQTAVAKGEFRMAWIGLRDPATERLKVTAHAGATPETVAIVQALLDQPTRAESCGFTLRALDTGAPAVCNDIAQDPHSAHWRVAALERGYRAMAALPLQSDGQVIGTFNLYAGEIWFFDAEEMRLLEELALDISFALHVAAQERERQRAEAALRESTRRLRALTARMETLREDERIRISREIHDELGQKITALKMDLYWLENRLERIGDEKLRTAMEEKIVAASSAADETMTTVQRIAAELRPAMLDNLGLIATLRHEAHEFEKRAAIPVQLQVPGQPVQLNNEITTATYRIFQEVLTNVARHAKATAVEASLTITNSTLRLQVTDNGIGVRREELARTQSLGLLGMTERAAMLGGNIQINGTPGRGTTVQLEIPIAKPPAVDKHS